MTSSDLKTIAIKLFGHKAWRSRLAERLGVNRSTVTRWMNSGEVPGPVAAAVECWDRCEVKR